MMRERLIWISAGLLGLLLAAALAGATSRVTTPDVGLAGEPVSAGEALAPPTAGGTAQPVTAAPAKARPVKRARKAAKKTKIAKRVAAAKPAVEPVRTPALASVAPKAATAPAQTRTTTQPKKRATATVTPVTVRRRHPPATVPVLTQPTITVPDDVGDVSGKDRGGDSGKGKGGGGDD